MSFDLSIYRCSRPTQRETALMQGCSVEGTWKVVPNTEIVDRDSEILPMCAVVALEESIFCDHKFKRCYNIPQDYVCYRIDGGSDYMEFDYAKSYSEKEKGNIVHVSISSEAYYDAFYIHKLKTFNVTKLEELYSSKDRKVHEELERSLDRKIENGEHVIVPGSALRQITKVSSNLEYNSREMYLTLEDPTACLVYYANW